MAQTIDSYAAVRDECVSNQERNVFVMMRYREDEQYKQIEATIRNVLVKHGYIPRFAKDKEYTPELWSNVKFCMDNSTYGIAVFEDIDRTVKHNPNVALELGYMRALEKRCLILKEGRLETLPTDIISHLYHQFDAFAIEATVTRVVERWVQEIQHAAPFVTLHGDWTDVQILRTQRIIGEYERVLASEEPVVIRLAGFLTALALSGSASRQLGMTDELMNLYQRERDLLLNLIASGKTIRCIIAPSVYVQRLRDDTRLLDEAEAFYLPRYNALIEIVNTFYDNDALQIIWSEQLPRQSLIATDSLVFVGTRTTHERQTRTTIISAAGLRHHEVEEFEYVFEDTVEHFKKRKGFSDNVHLWKELKHSVIHQATEARDHLQQAIIELRLSQPSVNRIA